MLVSLHLNAGGGHGTETYTHPGASAQSKKLAAAVQYRVLDALGVTDRGVKSHGYAVIAGKCPAILCEVAFIDSASDMRRLVAFGMYRKVAVAIADGIEAAFGVVRVSPPKPKPLVKPEPCEQTLILVSSVDKQSVIAAMRGLGQHVIQLAAEDGALLRVHHASRLTAKVEAEVERCGGTVRDVLPARWHDTTAREVNPSSGKSIGRVW